MLRRSLTILLVLGLQLLLPTVSTALARTISWSGYTWDVRPEGFGTPGPNDWSDSDANVSVDGSDLVLSIIKDPFGRWTSSQVASQTHLGYGTYRWVVGSDLSTLDSHEVLGLFTYGGPSPSNNEIDLEAAHWGRASSPAGSGTVWQDAAANENESKSFRYTPRPPYVHQFTWMPGRITYLVTDATGATLFDWTVTSGVPTPSSEVPVINYWRFDGAAPDSVRTMRIKSFTWSPPDQTNATAAAAPVSVRLAMRARALAAGKRRSVTVRWSSSGRARLRLSVQHLVRGRFAPVGSVTRSVRRGSGSLRLGATVSGARLRSGTYRLAVRPTDPAVRVRFAGRGSRFTVVGR